ncbi:MAG: two-component system, OmpR family, sensor kinase [Frankiales bacterium]|jgi:two-component system sensor histidine kinase BaeS|nr:two-component system, OmpR family, sensor kinase [Frankiales bacterium]
MTARTRRRRPSLSSRVTLVTIAVAVLAVLVAGLVSIGLVRTAAEDQARGQLGREADVVAGLSDDGGLRLKRPALARALQLDDISIVRINPGGRVAPVGGDGVISADDVRRLLAGQPISAVRRNGSAQRVFVEGRPADTAGAVVLWQPAQESRDAVWGALRRIGLALLIGLAIAAIAGALLARRLARPLQHAAAAAHQLSAGARDVRLQPEGPAEVAEVAEALNLLADSLAASEARQREFLLSVSHELRTPLTAVKGYAEALADGVVPTADVAATGSTMLGEAARLERLVADLLDLARLGAEDFRLDMSEVDITELARRAATVWSDRCARAGVLFGLELPDAPLVIRTDLTRVRQILDGLAENALRATPAGKPLILAVRREDDNQHSWAVLEVRDGGPGLTPDDQRVAFERSALHDRYRGKRRVGLGIGLALIGGLVARLGGTAHAGTAEEGGASFVVRLPVVGPDDHWNVADGGAPATVERAR